MWVFLYFCCGFFKTIGFTKKRKKKMILLCKGSLLVSTSKRYFFFRIELIIFFYHDAVRLKGFFPLSIWGPRSWIVDNTTILQHLGWKWITVTVLFACVNWSEPNYWITLQGVLTNCPLGEGIVIGPSLHEAILSIESCVKESSQFKNLNC